MWIKFWSVVYFFSCFAGLGALGVLLAMYTTGDLTKVVQMLKRHKWRVTHCPYEDRPWHMKIIYWLHFKKRRTRIWFKYHFDISIKRKKYKHLWYMLIRKCPRCQSRGKITLEHQNCAYVDEMSNYYWLCRDCHQEVYDLYQELWDDYNSGRL